MAASVLHRRLELEEEVSKLVKTLEDETRLRRVLEHALVPFSAGTTPLQVPRSLPEKTKELVAEVAMAEEEIVRLECQITRIQRGLRDEREARTGMGPIGSGASSVEAVIDPTPEKTRMEIQPLFFINRAIEGGSFDMSVDSRTKKSAAAKAGAKEEIKRRRGLKENATQRVGLKDNQSSIKQLLRSPKVLNPCLEISIDSPKLNSTGNFPNSGSSKWQPNKLSERIMKCLICIFIRQLRASRQAELEKTGNQTRHKTLSSATTRSHQVEGGLNPKATPTARRDAGRQDPYGIFEIEGSLPRDIGPYKNLVRFTANSFDQKGVSILLPLMNKLRELMTSLSDLDTKSLTRQQKLAFWINMHNACIMHGLLEHRLPSDPNKFQALKDKAMLNIDGNKLNARTIRSRVLGQPCDVKEDGGASTEGNPDGIENPDPCILFALCHGTRSSPALRIYTAESISMELEKAKMEYLQASVAVTGERKLAIPSMLYHNMHSFAGRPDFSLAEWICNQLPVTGSLRKHIVECLKWQRDRAVSNIVDVIPYGFEFQYLLSN